MVSMRQQGVDLLIEVWQNGNFDALSGICHADVKRHHERLPAQGLEEYRRIVEFYRNSFSDLKYDIDSLVEEGDKVAVMYTVTGTHTGPFGKIPATGVRETIRCIDFYYFSESRMTDIFTAFDELGLLIKLGAFGESTTKREDQSDNDTHTHTHTHTEIAKSLLARIWQDGLFDQLPLLVHEDVRRHHPRFPANTRDELKQMILAYRTAFSDMSYTFLHAAEQNENVALVYQVEATHLGPFGEIPPTGISDTMTCVDFFRFREDRISEIWTMFDELGMLIKMGVVKL